MRHAVTNLELHSILERIGKALLAEHDKITKEQLPTRLIELIRCLDDREGQEPEPHAREADMPEADRSRA